MIKLPGRGLTLIELLVTVSIIGVVFGIIISSAGMIQRYGRDAKRQTDLRSLQSALQQYYADQNFFPDDKASTPLKLSGVGTISSLTNCTGNPTPSCTVTKTYLTNIPSELPTMAGTPYYYQAFPSLADFLAGTPTPLCDNDTTKCFYYMLCAKLENSSGPTYTCRGNGTYNLRITPN